MNSISWNLCCQICQLLMFKLEVLGEADEIVTIEVLKTNRGQVLFSFIVLEEDALLASAGFSTCFGAASTQVTVFHSGGAPFPFWLLP